MKAILKTLGVLFLSSAPVFADVTEADVEACKAAPTSQCLADIGVALAMRETNHSGYNQSVDVLATMGRLDDALALQIWTGLVNGHSQTRAESHAEWRLAGYTMIKALRAGADFETTLSATPDLSVQTAFAQLAGTMGYGATLALEPQTDLDDLDLIRRYARRSLDGKMDRVIASGILLHIGDENAATDILLSLDAQSGPTPLLSDKQIKLIGTETALRLYRQGGAISFHQFLSLARSSETAAQELHMLEGALAASALVEDTHLKSRRMASLVTSATNLGRMDFAKDVTQSLKAELKGDRSVQSALFLARALVAIDGSKREVRTLLKRVRRGLKDLEGDRDSVVSELARRYAAIGDTKWAVRMTKMQDDPIRAWSIIGGKWPSDVSDDLMKAARKHLDDKAMSALLAKLVQFRSRPEKTADENAWALETAWRIVDGPVPPIAENAYLYHFDNLLKAAYRLENPALTEAVIARYIPEALATRSSRVILQAAYLIFQLEERGLH